MKTTTMIVLSTLTTSPTRFLLCGLFCFAIVLSKSAVTEGTYSNTVLYPVSEDARAARGGQQQQQRSDTDDSSYSYSYSNDKDNNNNNNNPTKKKTAKRQPGAPSRYLEYEGPDATYSIRIGTHPTISYPDLDDFPDTEIRIRYEHEHGATTNAPPNSKNSYSYSYSYSNGNKSGSGGTKYKNIFQVDDCPRHFLWLSDKAVQKEIDQRLQTGKWSERVLVEKAYFTLFYGGTGLASQYMDSVDDFQTDLKGWEIMNRSSNHCEWEGVECSNKNDNDNDNDSDKDNNNNDDDSCYDGDDRSVTDSAAASAVVVGFQINGFSLEGTLPHDLHHLTALKRLDLHGNRIKGSIPASWGNLVELTDLNLGDNRLTGKLPSTLKKWTNLQRVILSSNQFEGEISESLLGAWTKRNDNNSSSMSSSSNNKKIKTRRERYRSINEGCPIDGSDDSSTSACNNNDNGDDTIFPNVGGLQTLDLSKNQFGGPFPWKALIRYASNLESLNISKNLFSGILPEMIHCHSDDQVAPVLPIDHHQDEIDQLESSTTVQQQQQQGCIEPLSAAYYANNENVGMGKLRDLELSRNRFRGKLPREWMNLPYLRSLDLSKNQLTGSLPKEILKASRLERLTLSYNQLTGSIPSGEISRDDNTKSGWSNLDRLDILFLDQNQITGTIPYDFLDGLSSSLEELDLGSNNLVGSLPSALGKMTMLEMLDVHGNQLTGRLPPEMNRMYPDVELNLTDNLLTGTVPKLFCGGGVASSNLLFRHFGCDAILCPAGTFHPNGAASLSSGCRPCPVTKGDDALSARTLGQRRCGKDNNRTTFVHGDLNGDGILSEREVLRLLYTYTIGQNWGLQFESWADTTVDKCDLNGVVCVDGKVAKLDLTDASMCAKSDRKAAPTITTCMGIPAEISKLTQLEILTMNRRQYLKGTLPTEIGELTRLKYLDISSCPMMTGELPSEIGRLTDLKYLNIGGCRFNGTIPEELFKLSKMEKLHLSMNAFTGTVPSSVEKMSNLKELLLSRTYVNGTIPEGIGGLVALENFEMYGNQMYGAIPESLGRCTNLKRIDLFNNKLTGTIPESLTNIRALQILHIKLNHLTGTISSGFGKLPNLSWFDVSTNHLHGTIPESFGHSKTLKDFRLGGGNMIHNPVPKSLCSNTNINGGLTKAYGCSGVICPLGTYSDPGHATHSDGCKRCQNGRTTLYLGSSRCIELTDEDILTMFYDVMAASNTSPMQEHHWAFDMEGPVCTWKGVECDENETIETIWFPLFELNVDIYD